MGFWGALGGILGALGGASQGASGFAKKPDQPGSMVITPNTYTAPADILGYSLAIPDIARDMYKPDLANYYFTNAVLSSMLHGGDTSSYLPQYSNTDMGALGAIDSKISNLQTEIDLLKANIATQQGRTASKGYSHSRDSIIQRDTARLTTLSKELENLSRNKENYLMENYLNDIYKSAWGMVGNISGIPSNESPELTWNLKMINDAFGKAKAGKPSGWLDSLHAESNLSAASKAWRNKLDTLLSQSAKYGTAIPSLSNIYTSIGNMASNIYSNNPQTVSGSAIPANNSLAHGLGTMGSAMASGAGDLFAYDMAKNPGDYPGVYSKDRSGGYINIWGN